MAVELALTANSRWTAETPELIAASRAAGFTALGVAPARVTPGLRSDLDAAGVRCHELMALLLSSNADKNREQAEGLAAAAAAVGAEWVLTVFPAAITGTVAESLSECAQIVAAAGAKLALEFSPLGPVQTIDGAREALAVAGPQRAGVLIDSWHFFRGASTWGQLETVPLDEIAYVQFDDGLPPESDDAMAETTQRRTFPGLGEFELERFADSLLARGWDGTVSVEVLSTDLNELGVREFARRGYETSARYWLS